MTRVALLFDNTRRPETTGIYCKRALEELVSSGQITEIKHFVPTEFSQLARESGHWDLILVIDDGLDYDLPAEVAPIAWWAIDTHLDFERVLRRSKQARWTFAAQRLGADRLQQYGIDAIWLPLACDPELHGRQTVANRFDFSFVGNEFPGERQRLLELLAKRYPRSFVGQRYFTEMAAVYSASKVVFNRSLTDDINMRVFEGLCSGSLLLTNDLSMAGQQDLFKDEVHLITYQDDNELFRKIEYYLSHDEVRERIAAAGRAEVLAKHTYRHRIERLLEVVSTASNPNGQHKPTAKHGNVGLPVKDSMYFEFDRPDVQEMTPITATRILDIGCGAGRLGASLKARQNAHVTGVELNPQAAEIAGMQLDNVRIANVETDQLKFNDGQFDCVICADILEHLRQPELLLKQIRRWLSPSGTLVISVPNVRHHTVVQSLLAGNWTYESAGLLDADHVRLFTRRELEKLLFRTGFDIDDLRMVPGEGFAEWAAKGRPQDVALGGLQIRASSSTDASEFFAYQYVVRAVPQPVRNLPQSHVVKDSTLLNHQSRLLAGLADSFPWPTSRPNVTAPTEHLGWFADGARMALTRELTSGTQLVVELGSWLGLSTRFMADRAPKAKIIAIDHWRGSPEHLRQPALQAMLPTLFDSFLSLCWDYRDRIQPLRLSTRDGLQVVSDAGLKPDVIFLDADHTYAATKADLEDCRRLFPDAVLVGDDFDDPDVQRAVQEIADTEGLALEAFGENWRAWKLAVAQTTSNRPTTSMPSAESFGLTSIILVTWNQLAYTRMCLDSLRLRTDEPYELIVVDNGSTDGTVGYLRSLPDVRVVENAENRGFPAAANQGLQFARGANLLLLNNDTIVTTGWLRRMLDVLYSDRRIGLVGPTSNHVGSEQQIPVDYTHLNDLDGFAWMQRGRLLDSGEPLTQETDRLVGFCLLFRRELMNAIGFLDERFGIGCFEDDDFCRRALAAGYSAMIARSAFIHHFGSVTFQASGIDLGQILDENQRVYDDKWRDNQEPIVRDQRQGLNSSNGADAALCAQVGVHLAERERKSDLFDSQESRKSSLPRGQHIAQFAGADPYDTTECLERRPRPEFVLARDDDNNLIIEPIAIRLSGCLIVRNNENTIRPCLESLKPWVDEIIVVDTGSTDATPRIAEVLGAHVVHWAWRDDFAAARNVSLEHARGDWVFWMDSDDTLPNECGRKLRDLVNSEHDKQSPSILGYVMQVHCPGDEPTDVTVVDHVKLFRNLPDLRFEFRIHEQILPAIRRAGGEVAFTDIYVVHSGSDRSKDGQARKLERDFKLLELELADRPDHPFVLFNLGMTHADCGQHPQAIQFLQRCLEVSVSEESHVRKAYAILISSLMQSQRFDEAEQVCLKGRAIYPDDKELLFRLAMLEHQQGRLADSIATYQRVLSNSSDRHFTSIDMGLDGFKARHNLALVYEDLQDFESAASQWEAITVEQPDYLAAWRGLVQNWLRLRRMDDVNQLIGFLKRNPRSALRKIVPYMQGMISETLGNIDEALCAFEEADRLEPQDTIALQKTCRLLFETGRWPRARDALTQLSSRMPDDASVRHNLGLALLQTGNAEQAAAEFEHSLSLRPGYADTMELLSSARKRRNQIPVHH